METNEAMKYISDFTKKFAKEHFNENINVLFKDTKRRWGCCKPLVKEIDFSINFVTANKDNKKALEALAIHECCHLKCINHGKDFKKLCKTFGINESHIYRIDELKIVRPELKSYYLYKCPKCEREFKTLRILRKPNACGECCKKYNNGRFTNAFVLKFVEYKC